MLSKNKIKFIQSLDSKKKRKEENAFIAEGHKLVGDLLPHLSCRLIVATKEWLEQHAAVKANEIIEVTREELTKASLLKTPQEVIGIFNIPNTTFDSDILHRSLCLGLDDVQDPGNLGTIIRIADWFGIRHIFCSIGTVDAYNPKTIQATMGAIARVQLHYCNLRELIESHPDVPVFGTFLDGKNMYDTDLSTHGLIIMGNEGNGISSEIERLVNHKLYIPNYPQGEETSESLNVAMATGIVCAEFRRRMK